MNEERGRYPKDEFTAYKKDGQMFSIKWNVSRCPYCGQIECGC